MCSFLITLILLTALVAGVGLGWCVLTDHLDDVAQRRAFRDGQALRRKLGY
jgi:hypothetical protein